MIVQFLIRRLLATLPEGVDPVAKLLSTLYLTADNDRVHSAERKRD